MHPFLRIAKIVFSAHAEVVPDGKAEVQVEPGILRARGGSSKRGEMTGFGITYSPRTRR